MQGNRSMETEWSPALWHCRSFESPGSSHSSVKWTKPTLTIKTFINRVCQCVSRIIERRGYRIRGFLFVCFFFSALSGKKKAHKTQKRLLHEESESIWKQSLCLHLLPLRAFHSYSSMRIPLSLLPGGSSTVGAVAGLVLRLRVRTSRTEPFDGYGSLGQSNQVDMYRYSTYHCYCVCTSYKYMYVCIRSRRLR